MVSQGKSSFYLMCALLLALCFPACRKKELAGKEPIKSNEAGELVTVNNQYNNDLDRLGKLAEKINYASGRGNVFVFGAEGSPAAGNLISVDFALFNKLMDDGAAVLIAEAVALRTRNSPGVQGQENNVERSILQADEIAGIYVARAGFSQSGFSEWLDAAESFRGSIQQPKVPQELRLAAFMRGYLSVNSRK